MSQVIILVLLASDGSTWANVNDLFVACYTVCHDTLIITVRQLHKVHFKDIYNIVTV